jgi:hypothetical protein
LQSLFKRGLDGGLGLAAGEDDVAAGNEGADGAEPNSSQNALRSLVGTLPVPPTLTARSKATKAPMADSCA